MTESYIKQNNKKLYDFFIEYWGLVKKYWKVESSEEWWNGFINDLSYYIAKYDTSNFCVDLLMELYYRNRNINSDNFDVNNVTLFLKEWWNYVNTYYPDDNSQDEEWWNSFSSDTMKLNKKYERNSYFCGMIDCFARYKAQDVQDQI